MAERGLRQLHRRSAVRKCDRTERRVSNGRKISLNNGVISNRTRVVETQRHDQVVGMLSIDDGPAEGRLAGLKEFRIPAFRDGGWVETEHQLHHEAARSDAVLGR